MFILVTMIKSPQIKDIPEEERSTIVLQLLEVVDYQTELIQTLKDEIAVLKGNKPKPKIKPSGMEENTEKNKNTLSSSDKRAGSKKRSKTKTLKIDKEIRISPKDLPQGSKFKGFKDFVVQGIVIKTHNVLYRMERWKTPDGRYVHGELPVSVRGHFSSRLISYILYQYYQCHVTQPLLLEQLYEFGIDISSGQLSRILIEEQTQFHAEKDEILSTGLQISNYINVDDTGSRHKGKNGVCTHIGNELFAWFESTESKSRINFLKLLRAGSSNYCINMDALDYMKTQKLSQSNQQLLSEDNQVFFTSEDEWENHLQMLGITDKRHIRIATEGALIGNLFENGFNRNMVILSDDAGQFNVLLHALCWVHAERTIHKIVPFNESQRNALDLVRNKIWELYAKLKTYKENPCVEQKIKLENQFDEIFQEETCFITLNLAMKRLYKNKTELLLVLERPEIPLHNNASESDIREYAKRRKVSGCTKSSSGRQSRDTFTSLKKTIRKLGFSFWEYLNDRISRQYILPGIIDLMLQKVAFSP